MMYQRLSQYLLPGLVLLFFSLQCAAESSEEAASRFFPDADEVKAMSGDPPATGVYRDGELTGLVFETVDYAPIPAYSGKPVNMRLGLNRDGELVGGEILEHEEPIVLTGIPEKKIVDFLDQYVGKSIHDRMRVGLSSRKREGYDYVDAVSGATVTVVVMGDTIMRSARQAAVAHGLAEADEVDLREPATVKPDTYEQADWEALREQGAISRMTLTRGEVDDAFEGTEAEDVDNPPEDARDETFINLYASYLNTPTTGRNLLGEEHYNDLMERLDEGEHAIMLMADGRYSFKGTGFVRGGIFDRFQINQKDASIQFRDRDLVRAPDFVLDDIPEISEKDIFIIREENRFDPSEPWEVQLRVRRQYGALDSSFVNFSLDYEPVKAWFDIPDRKKLSDESDQPLWVSVWEDRTVQIAILGAGLGVLVFILLFQDWLTKRPRLLRPLRIGFLIYTVVFIGWYALAQLSVVNIFTFTNAVFTDFSWTTFLMDPMMFIMWSFVAATLLFWGRGVFCGWLCPFGAMQELINLAARKLKIPQFDVPFAVHERLWALKYLILLVLFGISLQSLGAAEQYSEVEPFKTAVTLHWQREWGFVLYAALLLVIGIFNHKFYCRYVCPLGAGLAIPARIRLFDWLKRHKECGSPCQICANECEIGAIHPDGRINPNECHYCLDCQVTYWDDQKCPPMIQKRKKREKMARTDADDSKKNPRKIPAVDVTG
ncbi:NosR/NirI family nitrous oxide reductase transcriptional regulator [Halospina denitrificans]|uniref:NosR/NirI family nitrous oxide reductase transcriptional regulator n=1 Tax=Halospina denitrificans TaxID=332522 RepID=A0A4R7JPZ0_9GAMM|nr:NosR/NirI family protein [Halospina denitrificans]TDT40170.1 NosR/NirI family nitrous oxide reductase transcriptional regulator [Halospina denitrificans]